MIDITSRGLSELGRLIVAAQRELMTCVGTSRGAELQATIRGYQVEVEKFAAERMS